VTVGGFPQVERRVAVPVAATLLIAVLLALTGTGVVVARTGGAAAPVVAAKAAAALPGPRDLTPSGDPLRVRIPAIGVDAPLVRLGLNPDRTLEVPGYDESGWYTGGSRPGDRGPAVIAAHVDSRTGPAVFYRLRELKAGDAVHVDYRDGTVTFSVRESQSFPKTSFPTAQVYGATVGPELRLITCDGTFDRKARSYRSNLVVWAGLASAG
jgi:LPXTG-site transpeptidase (sortase) family protein